MEFFLENAFTCTFTVLYRNRPASCGNSHEAHVVVIQIKTYASVPVRTVDNWAMAVVDSSVSHY